MDVVLQSIKDDLQFHYRRYTVSLKSRMIRLEEKIDTTLEEQNHGCTAFGPFRSREPWETAFAHLRPDTVMRAKKAQVEASAELVASLRQMVNDPDFSDVAFLCNHGEQVRASRIHLAARSDVLKSLLMNGMAESNLAEFKLPEVSSRVMLSVLEFLYTGSLLDSQSWKMGWEVIIASRFFLLPKLEIIVRMFMHAKIVSVSEDLPGVATLLTKALGFRAICEQGDEILMELVTILSSNWSDSVFVLLSIDVFHYLLVNTSCNLEDDDILSFREYLRFRQVINWWVCRSSLGSHSKEELMSFLVPDKERVMSICEHPEILETVENCPKEDVVRLLCDWNSLQSDKTLSMGAALRLLSNIEYRSIHPIVLAKVVEPLKICSGEVSNAFRFHALRRPMLFHMPVYRWDHDQSYSTFEHGHVIFRTGETSGLAMIKEKLNVRLHALYEWELVIEEGCSKFAELGFVSLGMSEYLGIKLDHALSSQRFAWVLEFNGKETRVSKGQAGGDTWKELRVQLCYGRARVSFVFDTGKQTCSLSINGQDFGVVWRSLKRLCYYPAMSFGACRRGRIRVKLVRGFGILQTPQSGH